MAVNTGSPVPLSQAAAKQRQGFPSASVQMGARFVKVYLLQLSHRMRRKQPSSTVGALFFSEKSMKHSSLFIFFFSLRAAGMP